METTATRRRVPNPTLSTWDEWRDALNAGDGLESLERLSWRLSDYEKAWDEGDLEPATFEQIGILFTAARWLRSDIATLIRYAEQIEKAAALVERERLEQSNA
jgi:hypothetical protein